MTDDERNMAIRKFLKRVGVETHEALNAALESAEAGADGLNVRMTLSFDGAEVPVKVFETNIGGR